MHSLIAAWLAASAVAAPVPESYASAVRLVDRLYLEQEDLGADALLRSAAEGLADDVHWLMVRTDGDTVHLSHGDGTPLGTVEVREMGGLPRALAALEALVVDSGHDTDDVDVRLSVLQGMTDGLDRYSKVLAGDRLDRFNVRLKGTLVGIGATFRLSGDAMRVTTIVGDGPAEEGGLQVGDRILRIDGRSSVNMPLSEAVRRVRGQAGTPVALTVERGERTLDIALTRGRVVVPNVTHDVLDGGVGYVHIDHISQQTVANLRKALDDLRVQGALDRGLVLDLRGNTGGSMKEAARSADQFLDDGLLLRTAGHDGERVQNLQAEMRATEAGDEPDIPVVVLVDERTASGSEILAGALLELDRAALVGTRTYGKGTVQKIYNLDDDVRLKLTVARYILANDRHIAERGLVPDVVVGAVHLDAYGARYDGWDEGWLRTPWEAVLPEVHEREGWRGAATPEVDLPRELARRTVLATSATDRTRTVAVLREQAAAVRAEQEQILGAALAARGIDWSEAPEDASFMDARVEVEATEGQADTLEVTVSVTNDGEEPLHRALVQLDSPSARWWSGVVVPVGRIAPGATATGTTRVRLVPGVDRREDPVTVRLRADRRPPLITGETVLGTASSAEPEVRLSARLVPHNDETGPHGWPVMRAEVTVHNLSRAPISGLEVHFGFPGHDDVELIDYASRVPVVRGRGSERLDLALEVGPDAPTVLPLQVVVETERHRELADWPLPLPTDGTEVTLQAPRIEARRPVLAAPAGVISVPVVVEDDRRIDHVVVRANGRKLQWAAGGDGTVELSPSFELYPGMNRLVVSTTDDQGIRAHRVFHIRGETPPATVDASDD